MLGLWSGEEIPFEAISAAGRTRTLAVGAVRAVLRNGEYFEGRLHAVGQGRIWLATTLGRMGLDWSDVKSLARITSVAGTGRGSSQDLALWTGVPRVEVFVPGGSFVGRMVAREGKRVTLVTDAGIRLQVESSAIRRAPTGEARVVGRLSDP